MGPSIVYLKTEKELRTYMHPLRQKILRTLRLHPDGMTAKQLAVVLSIAPSSAGHHLAELEKLGVVVMARTEIIHGFTAKFYQAADVCVSLSQAEEEAADAKDTLLRYGVEQVLNGYLESENLSGESYEREALFGVWYFTREEAKELSGLIWEYLDKHRQPGDGKIPYELALVAHVPERNV